MISPNQFDINLLLIYIWNNWQKYYYLIVWFLSLFTPWPLNSNQPTWLDSIATNLVARMALS